MPQRSDEFESNTDEPGDDFDAKLARLEKELGDKLDKQAAEDPLLNSPPKKFPIPAVLQEPPHRKGSYSAAEGNQATQSAVTMVYAIGTDFGVTILAGLAIGWVIDHFAKTNPWGLLGGLLVGFLVGGFRFFKEGMAANKRALDQYREGHGKRPR